MDGKIIKKTQFINQYKWSKLTLVKFDFKSKHNVKYKTFITQEMLKKRILATNTIYVSTAHKKSIVDKYLLELDKIFDIISKCENHNDDIAKYLISPIAETDFAKIKLIKCT